MSCWYFWYNANFSSEYDEGSRVTSNLCFGVMDAGRKDASGVCMESIREKGGSFCGGCFLVKD